MIQQGHNNDDIIPEYKAVGDALNDTALRVQQTLIAIQVYQESLRGVGKELPGLQIDGYSLKDLPVWWGQGKSPQTLEDNAKRSVTFTLLSALNLHVYLLDSFLVEIARTYYNVPIDKEESGWMTPEVFQMATGIDLSQLLNADAIEDARRIAGQLRKFKRSLSISIPDYFELYAKICVYITEIAVKVSEKVQKDKKI